jgi:hypothetical protein
MLLAISPNVFGLGEVAEPKAKLKNKTLKLKTND